MKTPSADLDRFLRAVHRRWVVVRIAEVTGIGVAVGCGLALLVLPILLWRGEPALPVVIAAAALAAVAGMIAGVIRRPNLASAAAEADRQLDLADLLSTALATRDRTANDPWAAMVVATASARCRTLAPGAVIVNRFGGRAWGGIGLATALVLTLGLMSANPRQSAAVTPAADDNAMEDGVASSRVLRQSPQHVHLGQTLRRTSVDGADRDIQGETMAGATTSDPAGQSTDTTSAGESGGGAGLATSPRTPSAPRPQQASAPGSRGEAVGDSSAGGTSAAPAPSSETDDRSSASSAASSRSTRAPAWRSSAWPTARDQALSGVRDGSVGGQYRDLVRTYFDQSTE